MSSFERTLATIEAFYDAALDEALWPAALQKLTQLTGSQASSFWVLDSGEDPRLSTFISINFDQSSIRDYLSHMASLDPTVRHLVAHPQQAIVHDGILENEQDHDSRAYYDWHEKNVETRFRMVGQVNIAPTVQAGIALHKTRKAGRYQSQDVERFAVLHRHLQRALAIGFRVGTLGALQQFGNDWLDRSPAAIVLLDAQQRVVCVNRPAQALQRLGDGIKLSRRGIVLGRKPDNDKLQSLIAQALSPLTSPQHFPGGALRASRSCGKRPYSIFVHPIYRAPGASSPLRAVCVVIADPESAPLSNLSAATLSALYDLTPMEAKITLELALGHSMEELQIAHAITANTARTHLKRVFLKTGVHRQAQLVALVWRMAQWAPPP